MSSLRKNILFNTVLTGAHYAFPLIVYPYVSRVLGVENIGLVGFIDSLATYFILFSMMGISIVGVREIAGCGEDRRLRKQVFMSLLSLHALVTVVAAAGMLVATFTVDQLREHADLMWVSVCKLIFNLFIIEWFYRGIEDFRFITIRSIVIRGLYVVAVFVFVRSETDTYIYYFLTMLVVAVTAIVNILSTGKFMIPEKVSFRVFRFIKPFLILGVYELLMAAYTTLNTAFLGFVSNDTEVGYYTTAVKLISILSGIYISFSGVLLPRMSSFATTGDLYHFNNYFKKTFWIILCFSLPVIVLVEMFTPEVVMLLSGPGYEGAVAPLRIMMPFIAVLGIEQLITVQTLLPMRREKAILCIAFCGAATAILLNLLLVPSLGAIGSAWTWAAAETVILIAASVFLFSTRMKNA